MWGSACGGGRLTLPVHRKACIAEGGLGPAQWARADRVQGRCLTPAVVQATRASRCRRSEPLVIRGNGCRGCRGPQERRPSASSSPHTHTFVDGGFGAGPRPHARPCLAFCVQHHPGLIKGIINSTRRPGTADQRTGPLGAALTHGLAVNQYGACKARPRPSSPLRKPDASNTF